LPGAIPVKDGVKNLLKYAFNMDLSGPDVGVLTPVTGMAGLPRITQYGSGASGIFRYEFLRRKGSGLVYTPRKSSTLESPSWIPLSATPTVVPINATWERAIYEEPVHLTTAPCYFGIIEVFLP
jgi:hypothetical protein